MFTSGYIFVQFLLDKKCGTVSLSSELTWQLERFVPLDVGAGGDGVRLRRLQILLAHRHSPHSIAPSVSHSSILTDSTLYLAPIEQD